MNRMECCLYFFARSAEIQATTVIDWDKILSTPDLQDHANSEEPKNIRKIIDFGINKEENKCV